MLVPLTDTKGRRRWINAVYVKSLSEKGLRTEIEVSGWSFKFKVDRPAEQVAAELNAAMPDLGSILGPIDSESAAQQAAQQSMGAAGVPGVL